MNGSSGACSKKVYKSGREIWNVFFILVWSDVGYSLKKLLNQKVRFYTTRVAIASGQTNNM
jgi:hypothetical protein